MNDPVTAADQITGIAAAEALDRRHEVDQQIQNAKRGVTTALQQLAAYWGHSESRSHWRTHYGKKCLRVTCSLNQ